MTTPKTRNCDTGALVKPEEIIVSLSQLVCCAGGLKVVEVAANGDYGKRRISGRTVDVCASEGMAGVFVCQRRRNGKWRGGLS